MKQVLVTSALALVVGFGALPSVSLDAQSAGAAASGVPAGELALGSVRISRDVMANGQPLRAGTYTLRLTPESPSPMPPGQLPDLNRWVEFRRGNQVVGREVVSIVPQSEIRDVAQDVPPRPGGSKVQLLKGNEYLRVWINRGGTHYLIHLPTGQTS
jgi:hypothetical protein